MFLEKMLTSVDDSDVVLQADKCDSVEGFLTSIYKEVEAEALFFLARYSRIQGVSMHEDTAIEAVKKELVGIIENAVGELTRWKDVPIEVRRKIIPTKIIISAEKIKEGILKRLKDRLVDLGNLQKSEEERSLSSPTPSITTVMVQAAKVAAEGRHVLTFHVSQAFLNADIDDDRTYVRLPRRVADILVSIDSRY